MSNSSARSDSSSSYEKVILPPVGPVGQKKTIQFIGDTKTIDKGKLAEWMTGIGNLYGSIELRESVTNLHLQLTAAIDTLKKVSKFSNEKLKEESRKLTEEYTILVIVCEKMLIKMEKTADFNNTDPLFESWF
ncbi:hypothetical protein CAEBREN_18015 [Caenorhabditis brenneri]|uniref:Uncharacterized protein n=1 Tax=Caenorhabditis brenneri TaxID=135651 RepID=G0NPV5_CAEBE|nr:hypothetical protein CAEBREN_18015 [Caenorhabditis brenneri]